MAKWFRVHTGTWHDYKLQQMDWQPRCCWYGLMELAAESNFEEGIIQGSPHRVARWMGINTTRWQKFEELYESLDLVKREDNLLHILNWKKRQYLPEKQESVPSKKPSKSDSPDTDTYKDFNNNINNTQVAPVDNSEELVKKENEQLIIQLIDKGIIKGGRVFHQLWTTARSDGAPKKMSHHFLNYWLKQIIWKLENGTPVDSIWPYYSKVPEEGEFASMLSKIYSDWQMENETQHSRGNVDFEEIERRLKGVT